MFHNVLMTTLTPIQNTNKTRCWENKSFTTVWPEVKQEKSKDISINKTIKKKKRNRTMFTTDQVRVLEKVFARSKYIDAEKRREISECLRIEPKCIKIWFQNRRMKEKKELSESSDSTSEDQKSNLTSLSPPLDSPQRSNNEFDSSHTLPEAQSELGPTQYYYNYPYNYIKAEVNQDEVNNYESSNNPITPEYVNYDNNNFNPYMMRNNVNYPSQYYSQQPDFHYYYNTVGVNNHNIRDWPANVYDTSYV